MASYRLLIFLMIASVSADEKIDLNSYCKGLCSNRYQDGMYLNGKCACVDYLNAEPGHKLKAPKRVKEAEAPQVYDGVDVIHYAEAE